MSKEYDLDVAHGKDWLSRETYEAIKAEVDTWPDWKKKAYGLDAYIDDCKHQK